MVALFDDCIQSAERDQKGQFNIHDALDEHHLNLCLMVVLQRGGHLALRESDFFEDLPLPAVFQQSLATETDCRRLR